MDLIAALDEAEEEPLRGHRVQYSSASGSNTGANDTPSGKSPYKRLRSFSSLDRQTTSSASVDGESTGMPQATRKRQPCRSCSRVFQHDHSYITPNAPVEWAYADGRGDYCKDCFNAWRVCLQHVVPLAMLPMHIHQNTALWKLQVVASLSLRMEGRERVECALVHARVEMLRWLEQFLGVPLASPFVVRPLGEVTTKVKQHFVVTMVSKGRATLGYFDQIAPSGRTTMTAFPPATSVQQLHNACYTDVAEDEALHSSHCERARSSAARMTSADKGDAEEDLMPAQTDAAKFRLRVDASLGIARATISMFATESWHTLAKESACTKLLQDLSKLRVVATGKSDQKSLDMVDDWSEGLTTIKNFLKAYREYTRSLKNERLGVVQQSANNVVEFLRGHALAMSASFELFVAKVNFIKLAEKSLVAAAVHLREQACVETFKRHAENAEPDDQKPHLDVWLRGLLVQVVPEWLRATKLDDDFDNTVTKWSHDMNGATDVLRDTFGAPAEEESLCAEAFLADVESLRVVFAVAAHGASPETKCDAGQARAALERLRSGRTLKQHFSKALASPAGKEVVLRVSMFLQTSAQYVIADSKLACAIGALKDHRLLSVEADPDTPGVNVLINFDNNPIMIDTILENMASIVEAKLLWTAMGSQRAAPSCREWLDLATRKLVLWDQAASSRVYCSFRPLLDSAMEDEARPIELRDELDGALGREEEEQQSEEATGLFATLVSFVEAVQGVLMDDALVKDVRGVVAEIEQHMQTRNSLWSFHSAVLNFPVAELETEPAVAVRQWLDTQLVGQACYGVLGAALRMRTIGCSQLKTGSLGFDTKRFAPIGGKLSIDFDRTGEKMRFRGLTLHRFLLCSPSSMCAIRQASSWTSASV